VKADARTVLDAITRFVGAAHCIVDPVQQQPFVTDYRRIHHGRAVAVVRPGTTQQVSDVVRWCADHRVAIVPQGGNTSLLGGAVPDDSGTSVVLSLARMNRVLCVDAVNDTITVEAGVTLEAARAAAAQHGRLFPLRIGSEGSCQIGGNLSTNAGGTAVLRYGSMRDLVLGVEAVTADGSVYRGLRGLRKDNTGYDVKQLFVGSEGSLGIITAAVLKLYPLPRASAVALVAVRDPTAALALLGQAKASCSQWLSAFELVSGPAIDLVMHHLPGAVRPLPPQHDWMVLLELASGGSQEALDAGLVALLEQAVERGHATDATVAASLAQAQALWHIRESISDAQTQERGSVRCDVSVPISRIPAFIDAATRAVLALEPQARMIVYGHLGDGNVHFNPLRPAHTDADAFVRRHAAAIARAVDDLAHAAEGSISAEHGVGIDKRDALLAYKSRAELELMWRIKHALDPRNVLNPGKVLPVLPEDPLRLGDRAALARLADAGQPEREGLPDAGHGP
jgi:FAD/FMN-containing dehydrogenase